MNVMTVLSPFASSEGEERARFVRHFDPLHAHRLNPYDFFVFEPPLEYTPYTFDCRSDVPLRIPYVTRPFVELDNRFLCHRRQPCQPSHVLFVERVPCVFRPVRRHEPRNALANLGEALRLYRSECFRGDVWVQLVRRKSTRMISPEGPLALAGPLRRDV